MVLRKVWKWGEKAFFYTAFTTMLLVILPGLPPYVSFKSFKVTPPRNLEGPLKPNGVLDKAVKLIDGELVGAESIVIANDGALYTGLADGRIVRIDDTAKGPKISTVAQLGKPCGPGQYHDCSRPLGIRTDSSGNLIVADFYKGIAKINPKTGKSEILVNLKDPIEGSPASAPDDLDVAKDGTVYWSDMINFPYHEMTIASITDMSGRLIRYDPKTKNNTVLLNRLSFANGVQLAKDESFVLINESSRGRTLRYYLKGPKAGTHDVFVDGLPGMPDNIRPNGKGGFYITLFGPHSPIILSAGPLPQFRKLAFRVHWIVVHALKLIDSVRVFSGTTLTSTINYIEQFGPYGFKQSTPIIVEVDKDGKIINSLQVKSQNSEMLGVTQFTRGDKYAYIGSYAGDKIWKLAVKELP